MGIALWIVQILVGLAFLAAGFMKLTQPKEKLAENMAWVEDFDANIIKAIGLVEVLGALGVILPHRLDIVAFLTPLAAAGLILTMIGAVFTHIRRSEMPQILPNIILGGLAAFVLWQTWALFGF